MVKRVLTGGLLVLSEWQATAAWLTLLWPHQGGSQITLTRPRASAWHSFASWWVTSTGLPSECSVCYSSNSCFLPVWNINTSLLELLCGPVYAPDCGGSSHKMRCFIPTRDTQASTHFLFSLRLLQTQSKDGQRKQFSWLEPSIILPYGSLVADTKENKSSQYLTSGFHPCEFRS